MNATEPVTSQPAQGQLGLWDAISIIVGIVIGTTIFELPWLIFASTPNPWMGLAVWVFGGILALIGGLCYAELATTYPRDGGDYYYLTHAFGRLTGFLFGWAQLVVVLPASIGVMAFVFANRATEMKPFEELFGVDLSNIGLSSDFYYAALAVTVITLLNLLGVMLGKIAQNILTVAKIVGLAAILVCGFITMKPGETDWSLPRTFAALQWESLALILVLYAYGGWNDAAFVAAEVRNPSRNIPRALLYGIGAITVIYVLINLAYILGLGFNNVRSPSSLPERLLTEAFGKFGENLGKYGGMAMSAIVMVSALGAVNGLIFTGSRVYATLGADHRLFGFLGHWRPGRGAPILALILQAVITLALVLLFGTSQGHTAINQFLAWLNASLTSIAQNFDPESIVRIQYSEEWKPREAFAELVTHSSPAFWLFFLLAGLALFKLRQKNPNRPRPFSVPWFPFVPFIFCNMCLYMLYRSIDYIQWRTLFVVALLALGLPFYLLSEAMGRPPMRPESE